MGTRLRLLRGRCCMGMRRLRTLQRMRRRGIVRVLRRIRRPRWHLLQPPRLPLPLLQGGIQPLVLELVSLWASLRVLRLCGRFGRGRRGNGCRDPPMVKTQRPPVELEVNGARHELIS
ncbi:hypothetical protein BO83DRAFT_87306 [Aspergillus eucalypticola CBS 122712]|uniref:Uncharacterized protein n=1 Tax=Aspergillus eucalypticola (strain CBS 122712 / IBT 29274) TaxID=1448314 RepID=A0A317V232_ASPEC|nr:uncharacterized protein BO83DRAFT_87306 [Aspergillus eucalypticola CBS 122712]PWY68145.1 hypothetical protein BO83DRAFT_87306 [Aspergillus eucalypticola CBS 122712]